MSKQWRRLSRNIIDTLKIVQIRRFWPHGTLYQLAEHAHKHCENSIAVTEHVKTTRKGGLSGNGGVGEGYWRSIPVCRRKT